MAFDVNTIVRSKEFRLETDSRDTIRCVPLTEEMRNDIEAHLKTDNFSSLTIVRKLIGHVGHRLADKQVEKSEPFDEAQLTENDVDGLSNECIEHFARKFVEHNDWLFESRESGKRYATLDKSTNNLVWEKPALISIPKESDERDSDYLFRLFRRFLSERDKRIKHLMTSNTWPSFSNTFSTTTESLLKHHLSMSDKLQATLKSFESHPANATLASNLDASTQNPEFVSNRINHAREINQRLDDMLDTMNETRPIIVQSVELIRSMTNTVIQIHVDFNKNARRSFIFSLFVIVIALLSLFVTATFSWWSYKQSSTQEAQYQIYLENQQALIVDLFQQQKNRYQEIFQHQNKNIEFLIERYAEQIDRLIEELLRSDQFKK